MTIMSGVLRKDAVTWNEEKELWAIALWIEEQHGEDGDVFIAEQMDRLIAEGEREGLGLWQDVWVRFEALTIPANELS